MSVIASALVGFLLLSAATTVVAPGTTPTEVTSQPTFSVRLTGYNAVPAQTKPDPTYTADGAFANPAVVAARSRDLADELPFGTVIEILGPTVPSTTCGYNVVAPLIGYRVIADTMNERMKNGIDILFSTKANFIASDGSSINASNILGSCQNVAIRVVGKIDPNHMPQTAAALTEIVEGKVPGIALAD